MPQAAVSLPCSPPPADSKTPLGSDGAVALQSSRPARVEPSPAARATDLPSARPEQGPAQTPAPGRPGMLRSERDEAAATDCLSLSKTVPAKTAAAVSATADSDDDFLADVRPRRLMPAAGKEATPKLNLLPRI